MAVELEDPAGEHVVHFYEDEPQLARTVGAYLAAAVEEGAVAIVIATDHHRRAFEAELEAVGVDPAALCAARALTFVDAAATLAGFIDQGRVDHEGFRKVVGSLVRQAAETRRPVRAYGEMVGLLWEAGDVLAAIELERAWNELARELRFTLLCGYRSESVHGDEHADALREVCHLHTSVLPSATADESQQDAACREVCAHFSTERTAPRNARHFVTEALKRWGHAATVVDDAQLVVTELATNAVVHARSPFSVKLRSRDRGVHLEVDDANPVKPTLRVGEPPDMSCRGLQLVDAIAANWGVEPATHGKTVWAELAP